MQPLVAERATSPFARHRRLRRTPALRALVREQRIDPAKLLLPVFVDARIARPEPIVSTVSSSSFATGASSETPPLKSP